MENESVSDVNNYYEMAKATTQIDETDAAVRDFYTAVSEAREKHQLPDVLVIVSGTVAKPDGLVGKYINHHHFGQEANELQMLAYAFGVVHRKHTQRIRKFLNGKHR